MMTHQGMLGHPGSDDRTREAMESVFEHTEMGDENHEGKLRERCQTDKRV